MSILSNSPRFVKITLGKPCENMLLRKFVIQLPPLRHYFVISSCPENENKGNSSKPMILILERNLGQYIKYKE